MKRLAKLTGPSSIPIGGMMMSLTRDVTILPKAPPMMMPTAMSTARAFEREIVKLFEHSHDLFLQYDV